MQIYESGMAKFNLATHSPPHESHYKEIIEISYRYKLLE